MIIAEPSNPCLFEEVFDDLIVSCNNLSGLWFYIPVKLQAQQEIILWHGRIMNILIVFFMVHRKIVCFHSFLLYR